MMQLPTKKNSGKVIKAYAQTVKNLLIIVSVILALPFTIGGFAITKLISEVSYKGGGTVYALLGILIGFLIIIVGCNIAVIVAAMISGYGEIVENSAETATGAQYLCAVKGAAIEDVDSRIIDAANLAKKECISKDQQNKLTVAPDGVHVKKSTGVAVDCPYCKEQVSYGSKYCPKCGKEFFFE